MRKKTRFDFSMIAGLVCFGIVFAAQNSYVYASTTADDNESLSNNTTAFYQDEVVNAEAEGEDESDFIAKTQKDGDLYWNINAKGHLEIWGEGDYQTHAWNRYYDLVKTAKVNVTGIKTTAYMFYMFPELSEIDLTGLDTSSVTNMTAMFSCCESLESIDVSGLNTTNVANMQEMFSNCKSLKSINLSHFKTGNVSNMKGMFEGCEEIRSINLNNIDTSYVTDMSHMFDLCKNLENLDITNVNTSHVKDMSYMFAGSNLSNLKLTTFNTENVSNMEGMFANSSGIANELWYLMNTENVTNMSRMFEESDLAEIDISSHDTKNVVTMRNIFHGCINLKKVSLKNINTQNVEDMSGLFFECQTLENVDMSGIDTNRVKRMDYMFYCCEKLEVIDVSSFNTANVENMVGMFAGCKKLRNLDLSGFNTMNVTHICADAWSNENCGMFTGCESLESLDLSSFDTSKVESLDTLFYGCLKIKYIDLSGFDTSHVKSMNYLFGQCRSLEHIDFGNIDTSNVRFMEGMFYYCWSLEELDLSSFNTMNVELMGGMFYFCKKLTKLDLSGFVTPNLKEVFTASSSSRAEFQYTYRGIIYRSPLYPPYRTYYEYLPSKGGIFYHCDSLMNLDICNFDTTQIESTLDMFCCCYSLTQLDLKNLKTDAVKSANRMFLDCLSLMDVTLPEDCNQLVIDEWNKLCRGNTTYTAGSQTAVLENKYTTTETISSGFMEMEGDTTNWKIIKNSTICTYSTGYEKTFDKYQLILSGSGSLPDFEVGAQPWKEYLWRINEIIVEDGITIIGENSFRDMTGVSGQIVLPSSIDTILGGAFYNMSALREVDIPMSVDYIQAPMTTDVKTYQGAFEECDATIICDYDSAAHKYATENGVKYKIREKYKIQTGENSYEGFSFGVEDYVNKSSKVYSPELAHMMISLCVAVHNKDYIARSMENMGFSQHTELVNEAGAEFGKAAHMIGVKKLDNGTNIVLVAIRGTTDSAMEILTDLSTLTGNYGFNMAADDIFNSLKGLTGGLDTSGKTKYFITGHSLGAAAANLLELKLSEANVPAESVYGYNFACPDVARDLGINWNLMGRHDNMFNIGNAADGITLVPGKLGGALIPGADWGKYGQSRWFSDNWARFSNTSAINWPFEEGKGVHLQGNYLKFLRKEPSFDSFRTWEQSKLQKLGSIVGIVRCPVDMIAYDPEGNRIASVIDGKKDYYDSKYGDVLIFTYNDEKMIYIEDGRGVHFEFIGTDDGTMLYTISNATLFSEATEDKTFENVALTKGKTMMSSVESTDDAITIEDVKLFVVDDEKENINEIKENGEETPLSDDDQDNNSQDSPHNGSGNGDSKNNNNQQSRTVVNGNTNNVNQSTTAGNNKTSLQTSKQSNPMTLKIRKKTYSRSKHLKKKKTFNIGVKNAIGKVTYVLNKKAKKAKIQVSKKGKVTIPKNCKKGTYTITVTAKGNDNYNSMKRTVKIQIKK